MLFSMLFLKVNFRANNRIGNEKVVDFMLEKGVDLNIRDFKGRTVYFFS